MLCWGNFSRVQILLRPLKQNPIPLEDRWTSLVSNKMRSCGTRGDGTPICWSSGFTVVPGFLPMTAKTLDNDWLDVAMNPERAFMRKQDRSLWTTYQGQNLVQTLPARMEEDKKGAKVASSSTSLHICAIEDSRAAWCASGYPFLVAVWPVAASLSTLVRCSLPSSMAARRVGSTLLPARIIPAA